MTLKGKPGAETLGSSPQTPGFIGWGFRKEAENWKGEAGCFSLFTGRPGGESGGP